MNTIDFKFNEFSGPLDLLLSFIDEEKMEINDVSISAVTEQYLNYIDTLEEIPAEDLADFLVVAARLLFMKSKGLLPELSDGEDDGTDLAAQLKLYKDFVHASKKIETLWLNELRSYGRIEPPLMPDHTIVPKNCTAKTLRDAMESLLIRLKPPKPLPRVFIDKAVSLKEKIDMIRQLLKRGGNIQFGHITSRENKTDIIVSFLALLELTKQRIVELEQDENFGDICITNHATHNI
jgi:segregation and condensation protein A